MVSVKKPSILSRISNRKCQRWVKITIYDTANDSIIWRISYTRRKRRKECWGHTKRVAARVHLPTPSLLSHPQLFEPLKRPDDRADYRLDGLQFPHPVQAPGTRFYTWVEWGAPKTVDGTAFRTEHWIEPPLSFSLKTSISSWALTRQTARWNRKVPR